MKLHLGCSDDLRQGYLNVDFAIPPGLVTMDAQLCGPTFGKNKVGAEFLQADLNHHWPWADSSVDQILANDVFEHIHHGKPGNNGKMHVMNEAWRVLKPGGILCFTVPCFYLIDGRVNPGAIADPTHCTWWTWDDQFYFSEQFNTPDGERGRLGPAYGIRALFRYPTVRQKKDTTWETDPGYSGPLEWHIRDDARGARTKLIGLLEAVK